ncbi:phosphorylase [Leptospira ognonensis]|uniref:Phosphorylase n=1 Tax=Leptospira ognonensis TaxID=2484945 RepID=A0A4V3JQT1_9LEPT|nr:phosphorylase [Leptospira ognonensis]TGL57166.1 phosphorylase [Leptospira ognonensis]
MSALFFALSQEAKPWIDALQLKPDSKQGHFRFYQNEKHTVVITGPGKLATAMAVTEMAQRLPREQRHPGFRVWNLGICGSTNMNHSIGDFFWANRIRDYERARDYFPEKIESLGWDKESHVTTVERPVTNMENLDSKFYQFLDKNKLEEMSLIDMEAAGFFEAASVYFELHQIQVGKIVSDHLEGTLCQASKIEELMQETKNKFLELFETDGLVTSREILSPEIWGKIKQFADSVYFTESMFVELKKSITYFKINHPYKEIPFPAVKQLERTFEKRDAKVAFSHWRALLHV